MKALAKELDEPFAERVDRLARELELAIRWDRPSILLAVYSSMYVMGDAAAALQARLREGGQQVVWVRVNGEADADIPLRLTEHPQRNGAVFFVSGLQWGGKTALRALNIRREYFVDQRLRAVFWLTESEAVAIAREAPDFWAFRHRVVEFVEPPEPGLAAEMARGLAWWGFEDRTLREDTEAKIALREALLADLPKGDETLAARAELQYTLGVLYWVDRQYERALGSINAALEAAQRTDNTRLEARCHNSLGNVYADLDRHEEAVVEYQRAIELDPKLAAPHNGLGNVYRVLGRHQEAVTEYQRAIELDPQFAYPHNGLGNVYADLGRYEEAVTEYRRAIELDPQSAYPHNGLGNVYYDLDRYEEAIAAYQRAIEFDPQFAYPHNGLGNVYYNLGRHEEAVAEYQRALEIGGLPDKGAKVYNSLGNVYAELGCHEEAIAEYQRAIELDPKDADFHNNLGTAYTALGCHDQAIAELQRAIELDPQFAIPHHNLGNVYDDLGRHEEAVAEYQRAIELDPKFAPAYFNWALAEVQRNNVDAALEQLKRAIALEPEEAIERAKKDSGFDSIRDDPRFQELVGEGSDTGAQEGEG